MLSLPAVFALAALSWFLLSPFVDRLEQTAPEDPHRQVIEDTLARTLRESRSGVTEVKIQAPPEARPDPGTNRASGPSDARTLQSDPTPPEGYEFVSHQGGMKRAPLPAQPIPEPSPNPAWLDTRIALDQLQRQATAADRDWTFAAARMAPGARRAELAGSLATLGAQLEGLSGEYARVRVSANPETLEAINNLPEILGLGAMPAELKVAREVAEKAFNHPPSEQVPVFITLMADDPTGEWRQPLSDLGVTAGAYDPALRTYTANMPYGALSAVTQADFVMAVEPIAIVEAAHATAVPVMGADALREYQHATGRFTGVTGQGIPIGVIDTGLNANHIDIKSGRNSVCGASFRYSEEWDLWADLHGHGSHITGTFAGAGKADPLLAGMAPNVSHIRFAKSLSYRGRGSSDDVRRGMDFLSGATGCIWNGQATPRIKPLIVNMSLAASGLTFSGRGVGERKLDSIVYSGNQLFVVAQANSADLGFSNYGTAKNSLAVGAVDDAGIIAPFSSHGPTADNRLAPSVVGTGVGLTSAVGQAQPTGYITFNGTSVASPSVAGVAALLMEAEPSFQNSSALARARLMASAIRPEAYLESPAHFPRNNTNGPGIIQNQYGMGLASTRASILTRDTEQGWMLGSATSEPADGNYDYVDINVPEGASRLDIVLTWDEQPADTLTKSVLNNLDLWVDEGADCTEEPCGEYSSLSARDNVEWLFIDSPAPGTHRIKVAPKRLFGEPVNAAVAWTIIRGDATPKLDIEVENSPINPTPGKLFQVDLLVRANQYIAAGVTLRGDCQNRSDASCSLFGIERPRTARVMREDGINNDLGVVDLAQSVSIGELAAGEPRRVRLQFSAPSNPSRLYLTASGWNARSAAIAVDVVPNSGFISSSESNTDAGTPEELPFANDEFADASAIQGETGEVDVDLLAASREPGEAYVSGGSRTLWYSWTAPSDGLFRFRLLRGDRSPSAANVHLYTGETLVSLVREAHAQGGELSFSAVEGVVYRVQIESSERYSRPLRLQWERSDVRPANDDFFFAHELSGATGTTKGSNEGATTERYEYWGDPAATVWYEWTAPGDGYWRFYVAARETVPMAFSGESLQDLRLVSAPGLRNPAIFPATAGETYFIAVATESAAEPGAQFSLTWREGSNSPREIAGNDLFENAIALEGAEGTARLNWRNDRSVEHGEPLETGTGTTWWKWTAPESAAYTWDFAYFGLQFSVFTGEALGDLSLVAHGSTGSAASFDARQGLTYWIAVGQPQRFLEWVVWNAWQMEWAKTPSNDDRESAAELAGSSGSVGADLKFATVEPDEPSDTLGLESVWWTWSAPSSGWHRFWVEDNPYWAIISIYPADEVGGAQSAPIASSERSFVASGLVQAHVLAQAGVRYDVRLSRRQQQDPGGPLSLRWESLASAPAFLAISESATNSTLQSEEIPSPLSNVRGIAISSDGTRLFATSQSRLLMFARDSTDGSLTTLDSYEADESSPPEVPGYRLSTARLHWDERFDQLVVYAGSAVYAFRLSAGRDSLIFAGKLRVEGNSAATASFFSRGIATDAQGTSLVSLDQNRSQMYVLRVDSATQLTMLQIVKAEGASGADELLVPAMRSPRDVTYSSDGSHVYLVAEDALLVFSRDASTGKLSLASEISRTEFSDSNPFDDMGAWESVELDASDGYLFIGSSAAPSAAVFDVSSNAADPRFLSVVLKFYRLDFERDRAAYAARYHLRVPTRMSGCRLAARHDELPAVDFLCPRGYYIARWNAATRELLVADWGESGFTDRFGSVVPRLQSSSVAQFAQSPDGRHLYAPRAGSGTSEGDAILIFQRAAAMTPDTD